MICFLYHSNSYSYFYVCSANEYRGHPVQADVIQKLRKVYGPQALFFWDETDGHHVGILWRPRFTREKPFTVMDCRYRTAFTHKKKNHKKRKADDDDDESDESESDDHYDDNMQVDGEGEVTTQPHVHEIIEHILMTSKGLLQRKEVDL